MRWPAHGLAVLLLLTADASVLHALATESPAPFRIWLDLYVFREGETNVMQDCIADSGGALELAGTTRAKLFTTKGHHSLQTHDLLWTGRKACYAAFKSPSVSIGNNVNCLPGSEAITGKTSLIRSLAAAYGPDGTAGVIPQSFVLPKQHAELAQHVRSVGTAGAWMLKESTHRGKGVVPVSGADVLRRAKERGKAGKARFILAQRFITDQLLLNGRAFTMRVWAVMAGGAPVLRCYLYGGILIFTDKELAQDEAGRRPDDYVVNIFQQDRKKAVDPWALADLQAHLLRTSGSDAAFQRFWEGVRRATAAAVAAAVPSVRRATAPSKLKRYHSGGFEVLGLDFLVDSQLRPWLVEVNHLPSMARKVVNCVPPERAAPAAKGAKPVDVCAPNPMDKEKAAFIAALLRVLAARQEGADRHVVEAANAVEPRLRDEARRGNARGVSKCKVTADILRQAADLRLEQQAAVKAGFSELTGMVYKSLACMAAANITGNEECALLPQPPSAAPGACAAEHHSGSGPWWRRAVHSAQSVLQSVPWLGGAMEYVHPAIKPVKRTRYKLTNSDRLVGAWLDRLEDDSQGEDASVAALLDQLCALEVQLGINAS